MFAIVVILRTVIDKKVTRLETLCRFSQYSNLEDFGVHNTIDLIGRGVGIEYAGPLRTDPVNGSVAFSSRGVYGFDRQRLLARGETEGGPRAAALAVTNSSSFAAFTTGSTISITQLDLVRCPIGAHFSVGSQVHDVALASNVTRRSTASDVTKVASVSAWSSTRCGEGILATSSC